MSQSRKRSVDSNTQNMKMIQGKNRIEECDETRMDKESNSSKFPDKVISTKTLKNVSTFSLL